MRKNVSVVLACMIGLALTLSPVFLNTLPVFLQSIAGETGWSRTQVVSGLSVCTITTMICSPFMGVFIDRFGPRRTLLISLLPFALSMSLFRMLPLSYGIYLAIAALIGAIGSGNNTYVYLSLLPQWFDKHLGLSFGIANAGIGIGLVLMPLLAAFLVANVGWRDGFAVVGAIVVCVGMLNVFFLFKENDGFVRAREAGVSGQRSALGGMSQREAIRTFVFWRVSIALFFVTTATVGCTFNMVSLLTDEGLTRVAAAGVASTIGLGVFTSRPVVGILLDRFDAGLVGAVAFIGAAIGILLIWLLPTGMQVYLGAFLIGCGLGVEGDLMPYIVRRAFGMQAYAGIYGCFWAVFNLGALVGPLLMSSSYDRLGSYQAMLVVFSMMTAAAGLLFAGLRLGPVRSTVMAER